MANLFEKYRIEIIAPGFGAFNAKPANNELKFSWKREKEQIFFRKYLNTELSFVNSSQFSTNDFEKLYAIETTRQFKCESIILNIYKQCNSTETLFWRGKLALVDANFDVDHCTLSITPRIMDEYDCFFENWTNELNPFSESNIQIGVKGASICNLPKDVITNYQEENIIETSYITIDYNQWQIIKSVGGKLLQDTVGSSQGWAFLREGNRTSVDNDIFIYIHREVSTQGCINGEPIRPAGDGWIKLSGDCLSGIKWVRQPIIVNGEVKKIKFKNGRRLNDILQYMAGDWKDQNCFKTCKLKVKSNFFGINPDGTNPNNSVYQTALNRCRNFVLHHITDISNYNATQQATLIYTDESRRPLLLTLKKLLNDLRVMFNVYWTIEPDGTGWSLRLEHLSYFRKNYMLDLIVDSLDGKTGYFNCTNGSFKYSYLKDEVPIKENFKFLYQTDTGKTGDFDGVPIEYAKNCTSENEETYSCELLTTHVNYIASNPDKFNGSDGWVLMETDGNGHFVYDIGKLTGKPELNVFLSFANLHEYFHQHGRAMVEGKMNSKFRQFKSYKKTKEMKFVVPMCCEDIDLFNPIDLVKTQLGWGIINEASYTVPSEILSLSILNS